MRSVSIDELHEHTDQLIAEVQSGEKLTLVRAGKPVAELVPLAAEDDHARREAARQRLLAIMDKGLDLGGKPFTYEERHDR
jgi:prevent-host-death family protein